jgi:type I restriction enzyme S subunit
MSEWQEITLEDLIEFNPKTTISKGMEAKKISMENVLPFNKRIQDFVVDKYSGGAKFKNGDTLLARITPCLENGKTAFVDILNDDEIAFGSTEFIVMRSKENLSDPQFIYYLAISEEFRDTAMQLMTGSTGRQRVETEALKNKVFTLPLFTEQKAIANVLSSLDDKIELLKRQNKSLDDLAETYFIQWFIENPSEEWEPTYLSTYISEIVGGDWGKETLEAGFNNEVICIRGTDIGNFSSTMLSNAPTRFIKSGKLTKCGLIDGDIVIEISGGSDDQSTGRSLYINSKILSMYSRPIICSNFCKVIRPQTSLYMYFLYMHIKVLYSAGEFFNYENGTSGIRNLALDAVLNEIEIKKPNDNFIKEKESFFNDIFLKTQENNTQIRTLSTLRDNLLTKLISGEVRVNM